MNELYLVRKGVERQGGKDDILRACCALGSGRNPFDIDTCENYILQPPVACVILPPRTFIVATPRLSPFAELRSRLIP